MDKLRKRRSTQLRAVIVGLCVGLGPAATASEINGAGATFPANLHEQWIEAYGEANPGDLVTYDPVGSGEGIRRFMVGSIDFGGTDRPMTDAQIAETEGGVLHVPATAGMVVVAYNLPGVLGELKLSRVALTAIFAGEVRHWDDPLIARDNAGLALPHRSIAVVVRLDSSGATGAFSTHLECISDIWKVRGISAGMLVNWPGGAMTATGNEGVAGRIAISEYSLRRVFLRSDAGPAHGAAREPLRRVRQADRGCRRRSARGGRSQNAGGRASNHHRSGR